MFDQTKLPSFEEIMQGLFYGVCFVAVVAILICFDYSIGGHAKYFNWEAFSMSDDVYDRANPIPEDRYTPEWQAHYKRLDANYKAAKSSRW